MRTALAVALLLAVVSGESEPNGFDPELVDASGKTVKLYTAILPSLDVSEIVLTPELRASDSDTIGGAKFICGYSLTGSDEVPFEAVMRDRTTGEAMLVLRNGVPIKFFNGEQYVLNITAFDCGEPVRHSLPARLVVTVTGSQLDEEAAVRPQAKESARTAATFFDQATYAATVREGTIYDRIINVRPNLVENPTAELPNICSYGIESTDVPFAIDRYGNIKNTEPLSYSNQKSYILEVYAVSCSGERSESALVTVTVTELCTPGWKNVPESSEFLVGNGVLNFLGSAKLESCEDKCESQKVTATVAFVSKQLSKVCEKDIASIHSQQKICGASRATVDLLPSRAAEHTWTKGLPTLDSDSAGQEVFNFDGKNAVIVPREAVNHTLTEHFTISMWMKHDDHFDNTPREQIICSADGDVMNRQHYSLSIHNCRLVLLLRKEAYEVDSMTTLYPAEWRWNIPEVCDGQWHHYALSVDYPRVRLYVNGNRVDADPHSVDILDDWALHPTKNIRFTELTVGACWQGSSHKMTEYFTGQLSGLSLLKDSSESDRVIKCLNVCGEKLSFHSVDALLPGMSVAYDSDMSRITVKGSTPAEVERIIRLIGYENRHQHAQQHGDRALSLTTNVMCSGASLQIPDIVSRISVLEADDPQITVSGLGSKLRTPKEFARGFNLFSEISIESRRRPADAKDPSAADNVDDINMAMVDKCQVRVNKPMNLVAGEMLELPVGLLDKYLLESSESDQGFDVSGADLFATYAEVLRGVIYRHPKVGDTFPGRTFTVRCFNLNGQFESNEFVLQVRVQVSEDLPSYAELPGPIAHAQVAKNGVLENSVFSTDELEVSSKESAVSSSPGVVMIVMIVVCAVFLVAIIAIAVIRIRKIQRRHATGASVIVEEGPEMEWDNSTLNLTINPLEQVDGGAAEKDYESDSDDECRGLKEKDAAETSEDEGEPVKGRDLEWDNSTLSY